MPTTIHLGINEVYGRVATRLLPGQCDDRPAALLQGVRIKLEFVQIRTLAARVVTPILKAPAHGDLYMHRCF